MIQLIFWLFSIVSLTVFRLIFALFEIPGAIKDFKEKSKISKYTLQEHIDNLIDYAEELYDSLTRSNSTLNSTLMKL